MESITFIPSGVCSRQYDIQYEGNKIVDIQIIGGCNGNLKGIRALLIGMDIDEANAAAASGTVYGRIVK